MHLLAGDVGRIDDGDVAVDLGQSPGDIVFLSAADSELAALAAAATARGDGAPEIRLANLMRLSHPLSVDLYLDRTARGARLVVVRMMGGAGYWSYGLDQLRGLARADGIRLAVIPGDGRWDPALDAWSTVDGEARRRLWRYFAEGGAANIGHALDCMAYLIGRGPPPQAPEILAHAGCYLPGDGPSSLETWAARTDMARPVAALVFYRSVLDGGSAEPVDALAEALAVEGLAVLPIFVTSLKDREAAAFVEAAFAAYPPAIVLNATAFAVSSLAGERKGTVLDRPGRPVLQVVFAGSTVEAWQASPRGLGPRDLAMNVVLPEVDGRLLTRAVSFKEEAAIDPATDSRVSVYRPVADRIAFVARQAAAWVRLANKPAKERRVALVLSDYPGRAGRLANGVGLDTPASAVRVADAMRDAGYDAAGFPGTGEALMARLSGDPGATLSLADYDAFLAEVPTTAREALVARWGAPEHDPLVRGGSFHLPVHRFGNVVVGVQPGRGYDIDPKATYHDPELVPPHHYLAFYAWLRAAFGADAIVEIGKHGNLEWLPGKALGLSASCWPEVALSATPLIYPFIVNDPGEGSQAKRRTSAVIVDHLMPPMTRAGSHGALAELETLIDEYYLAAGVDERRRVHLEREILRMSERAGLDRDLGLARGDSDGALRALDAHLCEVKEMQIRDGLHILGASPEGRARAETLVAIARTPRPGGRPDDPSLIRAIADDLGLGFDPLACDMAEAWTGPRPTVLVAVSDAVWRSAGDTVERIEALAVTYVELALAGDAAAAAERTCAVLDWIVTDLAPKLDVSGEREIAAVIAALDGRFVPPGPSGAPTRGRPDVLPTGRNFYSVDTRAVPTAAAWAIGCAAADAVALRYFQDEGEWPRSVALSAWGTSNMRTGGDDVAQVLAFIGAAPVWEPETGRVTGFRVLPLSELRRPRIDVTLKISGMFRDSFPEQLDLIDSAIRAVAALDDDDAANPIAAAARASAARLASAGLPAAAVERLAAARIFGAAPGGYGTGLQVMIDAGIWETRGDLAAAFTAWGGFAYGGGRQGDAAREAFAERLAATDAVVQNQDNREHDILDSDDYYQFQGGLAAAVEAARGEMPRIYHGDHSRPERPVIRPLREEIARVVGGRAANPKWIAGMMRHGYKGAFEIAATVDYLYAYAATTDAVGDHHFDALYDAYVGEPEVRDFMARHNPAALAGMAERFREAVDRGLWSPRRNSAYDRLSGLIAERQEAAE